jgi:ribosomal protein S18 acetylase RimI-like enzyme
MSAAFREHVRAGDPQCLRELVERTGVFSAEESAWPEELAQEVLDKGAASGLAFLIAEDAKGPIGFTCLGPVEGTDHRFDLYWIAVDPKAQGVGLGRELLRRSVTQARAMGAKMLYIETSTREDYAPARALYASAGFALAAVLPDFYRDGDGKAIFAQRV